MVDSRVKRGLVEGEYARRRAECEGAADALRVVALRDATCEQLSACDALDRDAGRRARHVIGEIRRTVEASQAIAGRDWMREKGFLE